MPTVGHVSKRKPTKKRKTPEIVGILPDIHIPKEDKQAVQWALETMEEQNITKLVLIGDVITLDSVSRFSKSLSARAGLPEEIEQGQDFIKKLDRRFGGLPVVYLQGNHENRLSQFLLRKAPELGELPQLMFRTLMNVPDHWEVLDYGDFTKEQGFLIQHGTAWGQNAARRNLLLGCSVVQGHSHRFKVMSHRCAGTDKILTSCELGCLCSFDQGYAKLTDWSHACGWLKDGNLFTACLQKE